MKRGRKSLSRNGTTVRKTYRIPQALADFIAFRADEREEDASEFVRAVLIKEMKLYLRGDSDEKVS